MLLLIDFWRIFSQSVWLQFIAVTRGVCLRHFRPPLFIHSFDAVRFDDPATISLSPRDLPFSVGEIRSMVFFSRSFTSGLRPQLFLLSSIERFISAIECYVWHFVVARFPHLFSSLLVFAFHEPWMQIQLMGCQL